MQKLTKVLKYIIMFVIVVLLGNIGLYLACSFKSNLVEKNVKESYHELNEQGLFYLLSEAFGIFNNNCTDTVIVNEAYSVDYKHPYISYMKARKNYKEGLTSYELDDITGEGVTVNYDYEADTETYGYDYDPIGELGNFLDGDIHYSLNYGRYWHGYLIWVRPLLILLNIGQIRTLLLVVYLALFIYLMYLINKRFSKNIAIIYGLSLICSGYFSASFSLESSSIFLLMMISSIILVKRIDKIKNFSLYLFCIGCLTSFFDYLTVPLISLGMLLTLYLLKLNEDNIDWKDSLKFVVLNSIIWMIGYASTWIFKWILYDLTIDGSSMLKVGFFQSFYRMQRINKNVSTTPFYAIHEMISKTSLYILMVWGIILVLNRAKKFNQSYDKKILSFLLIALMPIGWYIVLANHTAMHYYFTYRQLLVFMLGILFTFNEMLFSDRKEIKRSKKR